MNKRQQSDIRRVERALQTWQVLISAARNRQILTYEIVSDLIGVGSEGKGAIALRFYLVILMRYCDARGFPPITALVVKKHGGRPGGGYKPRSSGLDRDRECVFAHKWFQLPPLVPDDLRAFDKHQEKH
ncbi:MAG TPA: hypothetical protein VH024_03325 [Candidatus Angelobacter sp.]|nr:hypothetical protein [Candidatus Angelobacter sp.]